MAPALALAALMTSTVFSAGRVAMPELPDSPDSRESIATISDSFRVMETPVGPAGGEAGEADAPDDTDTRDADELPRAGTDAPSLALAPEDPSAAVVVPDPDLTEHDRQLRQAIENVVDRVPRPSGLVDTVVATVPVVSPPRPDAGDVATPVEDLVDDAPDPDPVAAPDPPTTPSEDLAAAEATPGTSVTSVTPDVDDEQDSEVKPGGAKARKPPGGKRLMGNGSAPVNPGPPADPGPPTEASGPDAHTPPGQADQQRPGHDPAGPVGR